MTLGELLRSVPAELEPFTDEAAIEANLIIEKVTGLRRPVLLSHPEREVDDAVTQEIFKIIHGRSQAIPLPYLLGEWEFFGNCFEVCPDVLIPRPETELLVERALEILKKQPEIAVAADIGTGSGCIAISLLKKVQNLRLLAVDISERTLRVAIRNARQNGVVKRLYPVQGNLATMLNPPQLLCANLPYIPTVDCDNVYEPMRALDGGADGFELYRQLFDDLKGKVTRETWILCEIEYRQKEIALAEAAKAFPNAISSVKNDLAGLPRLLEIDIKL